MAIVDWELAHLGDPMDDIAWLSLRGTQEPFTHLPDRLREYEELSGHEIDDDRVRYYRVMAEAKLLVMSYRRDEGGAGHRQPPRSTGCSTVGCGSRRWPTPSAWSRHSSRSHRRRPPAAHDRLYEQLLGELRAVIVPGIDDPLVRQRAKGLARVVKYLAAINRDGSFYESRELDDLAELVGERPASVAVGRAALVEAARAGALTAEEYLRYEWRQVLRDNELLRPASGVLADRHWPPLR